MFMSRTDRFELSPRRAAGRKRRGAAIVEFAVVAPVFFLLVFGTIEFGRLVMVQQVLVNAAREGARVAILSGSTTSKVTTAVDNYLSAAGISGATASVSPDPPSGATYGSSVTVTVSVPFSDVCWTLKPLFLSSTTQQAQCVMRTEQSGAAGS